MIDKIQSAEEDITISQTVVNRLERAIDNAKTLEDLLIIAKNTPLLYYQCLCRIFDRTEIIDPNKNNVDKKIDNLVKLYEEISYYPPIQNHAIDMLNSLDRNRVRNVLETKLENPDLNKRKAAKEILQILEMTD